jgi:nitrile hydratase subunit beta
MGRSRRLAGPAKAWQAGGQRQEDRLARINDVGGMQGFAPVQQEIDEPAFHADWEAHVFALNRALIGRGIYNLDEFRDAIERLPPQEYLASSYYEKWLHAITTLLADKGVLTQEEMAGG